MKILILGINGMLGRAVFNLFKSSDGFEVNGTVRGQKIPSYIDSKDYPLIITNIDVNNGIDSLNDLFLFKPDVVINCIGVIKQLTSANDPLVTIPVNTLFPHQINKLCSLFNARLIHISTDCVFTGDKGGYLESDTPDARDLYGISKWLGEVYDRNAITLRTSIIGHESCSKNSLLDWFLAQDDEVNGFSKAIFSGLPANELARVIRDYVIPKPNLSGLYHVSVDPINKYDLLKLIAEVYGKKIKINNSHDVVIDRSLNSQRFQQEFGYRPPRWPELIQSMHDIEFEVKNV